MGATIGIDLGTTNSCMAAVEGGKTVVIPNAEGERTTPSVVAFSKEGERLVGNVACRQAAMNAGRTFASVKRHMGTDWRATVDGKKFTPQELSAMILRKMRQDAEAYLGTSVTDAVVTVPAYFNDMQRQATKDAGRIAGLNVLRIINEPTAAALAYGLDNGTPQKVMVYDLGGGTFDVSVIEIGDGVIEVLATAGDNHLGGDDFDERVADYLVQEFKRATGVDVRHDPAAPQRVREAAREAKKDLSALASTRANLPFLAQGAAEPAAPGRGGDPLGFREHDARSGGAHHRPGAATRSWTRASPRPSWAGAAGGRLHAHAGRAGARARAHGQGAVSSSINPDECVAVGRSGSGLPRSPSASMGIVPVGGDILLLDVIPLSLSIETVGGVATRLIERNTTLPVHYSQVFSTAAAFQTSVEVRVLQGERPMAKDNKTIGTFRLKGIKRAPAGVPQIEVTFDIDANGILTVSAKDLDTGKEQSITITDTERMSDDEIEAAMRDAEQYAAQDQLRRDGLAVREEAQRLLGEVDRALGTAGKRLDKEEKKAVKNDEAALRKLLGKKGDAAAAEDVAALRAAVEQLEQSSAHARELADS